MFDFEFEKIEVLCKLRNFHLKCQKIKNQKGENMCDRK